MSNIDLFETNPPDGPGETSTDSYCAPPEVCECIRASVNECSVKSLRTGEASPRFRDHVVRVALDPWTNNRAIAHGWVGARFAWTIDAGRYPEDDVPWPLTQGDYVHGNPPYSGPSLYVERFLKELQRSKAWGGLVLKTDNRTQWWRDIQAHNPLVVLWDGPMNFFHKGERIRGNNFASTILVVDHTGMDRSRRHEQLQRAYDGKAWVYR